MKPKNRMVSFRLSAEEYDRLRQAGTAHGLNNLSELARVAMNRLLDTPAPVGLPEQVQELRVKIENLSTELKRLSQKT